MNIITFAKNRLKSLSIILLSTFISQHTHAESKMYFVHSDHLGTPQKLTNSEQEVVWSAEYTPFGEATVNGDPDGNGNSVELNVRLPGQYYDSESGLHYNYFRDYDPTLGRYIQSDPIGLGGGINTYAYALNNPVRYSDPTGQAVPLVVWGVCALGGCEAIAVWASVALGVGATVAINHAVDDWVSPVDDVGPDAWDDPLDDSNKTKKDNCIERCSESSLPTQDSGFAFWNCVNRCMDGPDECD